MRHAADRSDRRRRRESLVAGDGPMALEAMEPRVLLDGAPAAVAGGAGLVEVVYAGDGGLSLFVERADGTWARKDLSGWLSAGGPGQSAPNSVASWLDPKDGRTYHAVNAPGALAVVLDDDAHRIESVRVLSFEIAGAEPIASKVTAFTSRQGLVHVAGLTAAGDVVVYRQTGARDASGRFAWEFVNLSQEHLAPRGIATPSFGGALTSWVTPWNAMNIAGLDENGEVQAVWWAPGMDSWEVANLSDLTGAPTMSGTLTVYMTDWDAINIAGINPEGEIVVTWWVPGFGGEWRLTNFADSFGGPRFTPGTVMAYTTPWGGLNVGGMDDDGTLTIYWWVPDFGGQWELARDLVPVAEGFGGSGVQGFTSAGGTVNLVGVGSSGQVLRYSWRPEGEWTFKNLAVQSVFVHDDLDDDEMGTIIPALEPLAGAWKVTFSSSLLAGLVGGDFDDGLEDDDEPSVIALRADGKWLAGGDDGFGGLDAFGGGSGDRGTWTYQGSTVTINLPEMGYVRATGVAKTAQQFTTRGLNLNPSTRQLLEDMLDQYDSMFPGAGIREQIDALGGLNQVLASVELVWTRVG